MGRGKGEGKNRDRGKREEKKWKEGSNADYLIRRGPKARRTVRANYFCNSREPLSAVRTIEHRVLTDAGKQRLENFDTQNLRMMLWALSQHGSLKGLEV